MAPKLASCVDMFIGIGKAGTVRRDGLETDFLERAGINREGPQFWEPICTNLSDENLLYLFRGAVIAERDFDLLGGSVAANIWILGHLSKRLAPQVTYDAIVWALNNRSRRNSYTPFGSMYMENVFVSEGMELLKSCESDYLSSLWWTVNAKRNEIRRAHDEKQQIEKTSADANKKSEAEARAKAASERKAALTSELLRVSQMSILERLSWIVETDIPISAIPKELFGINEICDCYLGAPDLELIKDRLQRHKGHWKRLSEALIAKEDRQG